MIKEEKLQYEELEISIVVLEPADIITTSGFDGDHDSLYDDEKPQGYDW